MVKTSDRRPGRRAPRTARWAVALTLLSAGAAGLFTATVFLSADFRADLKRRSGAADTQEILAAAIRAPLHRLRALASTSRPPRLTLDVKFKHVHQIHERREAAIRAGTLETSDADFVPGTIELFGQTVRVRVRLAAGRVELLKGEKWPLTVRTRGDDHVFGMRHFELRPPSRAATVPPALLYAQLAREDIVAPRTGIVDLVWNGKPIGLMEYEEFPDTELLAHQQRRDFALLRLDSTPKLAAGGGVIAVAPLRPDRVAESRSLRRASKTAARLLQAYARGEVAAGDVFDRELWGRYLATLDVWGVESALRWQNLRFYLNPMTVRLEPVAYVGDVLGVTPDAFVPPDEMRFARTLLGDPWIAAAYADAHTRIAAEARTAEFARRVGAADTERLRWLHREYPMRLSFEVGAHFARTSEAASDLPPAPAGPRAGEARDRLDLLPIAAPPLEATLAAHPFLTWHAAEHELRVAAGRWDVAGSLVLPAGVGLAVPAGTTLRFEAREGLIARGPLRFEGRPEAPVVLEGPMARAPSQRWSGVYVVESSRPSRWDHVVVRNTAGFKLKGFELASGVVFRKAPITMTGCSLRNDISEDSLSMVRTRFALTDVEILDAELDAFDADYSSGTITGGNIDRALGDGIDLGGSTLEVRGTRLANIRDKAISVGEYSELVARDLEIDRVGIAVASKNGSRATISESRLRDIVDVGLVAYTNQPEFGPGTIVAHDNDFVRTELPALAQTGNRLELDGRSLRPVEVAINRLYKDREDEPR